MSRDTGHKSIKLDFSKIDLITENAHLKLDLMKVPVACEAVTIKVPHNPGLGDYVRMSALSSAGEVSKEQWQALCSISCENDALNRYHADQARLRDTSSFFGGDFGGYWSRGYIKDKQNYFHNKPEGSTILAAFLRGHFQQDINNEQ